VLKIELLDRDHNREQFDCGSEPLNKYLAQTARLHTERGISRTYVLVDEFSPSPKPIIGFFTLNICQLKAELLPEKWSKKLPRDIAGLKLGRLAIDINHQQKGFGSMLLVAAMEKMLEVFDRAGGIGVFVDAKDEKAATFYRNFGFESLNDNNLQLFLPLETIRKSLKER
jgi:hypothetical protein